LEMEVEFSNGEDTTNSGNQPMQLTGSQPPNAKILIGSEKTITKVRLGTYCWTAEGQSRCVDSIGPVELLKDTTPIKVKPSTEITFIMDYRPQPNKVHVTQIVDGTHTEVQVQDHTFQLPQQQGIYYYSYGVWWMDTEKENVAHGDAFYYFVLEVV